MAEFRMPSLGADMEDGILREWLVKPGDSVKRGDIIAVVETQKGLIDIEVFHAGRMEQFLIREGEKVPVGAVMAIISGEEAERAVQPASPPVRKEAEKPVPSPEAPAGRIRVSPLARKMAEEHHVDLKSVTGTGEGGSITKQDVEAAMVARPAKENAGYRDTVRLAVAAAMSRSNREIPHYYLETRVDMARALAWLAEYNRPHPAAKRLLPVALVLKAVARALEKVPELNASWENGVRVHEGIHIGFVVSLRSGGIVVPGIRDANRKSVAEIMEALSDIIIRAREGKLRSSDLSESTITVTSLGENSVETVLGIIYPPQVALVGVGSITEQPWAENGMLDVRPVLSVTLSADHRATDGNTGGRFLSEIRRILQKPEEL